ncbi:MAG: hypothetical protein ACXABY_23395 [Candidatus Thorarchaeota archaeon]|jgi:hypothetical protein
MQVEQSKELKNMYSRFGWKWAVLAYMSGRVLQDGKNLPKGFLKDLQLSGTKLESGCSSICDMAADLRNLEIALFPILLEKDQAEVHVMLELIGKAMNNTLEEKDIDLKGLDVVLADCTIPSVCQV